MSLFTINKCLCGWNLVGGVADLSQCYICRASTLLIYSFVVGLGDNEAPPTKPSGWPRHAVLLPWPSLPCWNHKLALRFGSVSIKILHRLPRLPTLTSQISVGSQLPGNSKACGWGELDLCTDFARQPILRGGSRLSGYPGRWSSSPLNFNTWNSDVLIKEIRLCATCWQLWAMLMFKSPCKLYLLCQNNSA